MTWTTQFCSDFSCCRIDWNTFPSPRVLAGWKYTILNCTDSTACPKLSLLGFPNVGQQVKRFIEQTTFVGWSWIRLHFVPTFPLDLQICFAHWLPIPRFREPEERNLTGGADSDSTLSRLMTATSNPCMSGTLSIKQKVSDRNITHKKKIGKSHNPLGKTTILIFWFFKFFYYILLSILFFCIPDVSLKSYLNLFVNKTHTPPEFIRSEKLIKDTVFGKPLRASSDHRRHQFHRWALKWDHMYFLVFFPLCVSKVDGSVSTFWDYMYRSRCFSGAERQDLHHIVADEIVHLTPDVKMIVMLRNPTERWPSNLWIEFSAIIHRTSVNVQIPSKRKNSTSFPLNITCRLYADYLYNNREKGNKVDFHEKVTTTVVAMMECLGRHSAWSCAQKMRAESIVTCFV